MCYGPEPDYPPAADPVPVLAFHGRADPVNPYDADPGTSPDYWTPRHSRGGRALATMARCDEPVEAPLGACVTRVDATCGGHAALGLYTREAAGHTRPGSSFAFPHYTGASGASLDATVLTLDWFARNPKRGSIAAPVS